MTSRLTTPGQLLIFVPAVFLPVVPERQWGLEDFQIAQAVNSRFPLSE